MLRTHTIHVALLSSLMGSTAFLASCQGASLAPRELEEEPEPDAPTEPLDERQRRARSGQDLLQPGAGGATPATAEGLTSALDIPGMFVSGTNLMGPDVSSSVLDGWGVIEPRSGNSFAVLSTGVVNTTPEPGTDMSTGGAEGDSVTLELDLEVPEGFTRLSFDYNFVSAEAPDFIGSVYNDTFTATLIDPNGTPHEIALASVNSSFFFDASAERAGGTTFDLFAADPSGVDVDFGIGLPDAGITDFQSVDVELPMTGSYTLVFDIHDEGDGILDSAVMLDNLRVYAMERLSLNSLPPPPPEEFNEPEFVELDGTIVENPELLTQAGQRIRGVTADGVTQMLLRTRTPGAGTVEYSVASGDVIADGGIGVLNGAPADAVVVDAVETASGEFWAFATYTAPADFDRGTDGDLATRAINIGANFVPTVPGLPTFQDTQEIVLARPPVVLVHGLWDGPLSWAIPLLDDPRFSIVRASYDSTVSLSEHSTTVPSEAILTARYVQQDDGIATSQVDVVAHGTGGLLARQHLDQAGYLDSENFGSGDVHKLITLNTPHLGSGFATATMEMWNALGVGGQAGMSGLLAAQGLSVNGGAVSDTRADSPFFALLGATEVPSHAIVGDGARSIPRGVPDAMGQIVDSPALTAIGRAKTLYALIEQLHPSLPPGPATSPEDRLAFIFGDASQVFAEDHDGFAEVSSQHGHIDPGATTAFRSVYLDASNSNYDSVHYNVPRSVAQSDLIVELLNDPVAGSTFGSFPAPSDILPPVPVAPLEEPSSPSPLSTTITPNGLNVLSPAEGTEVLPGTAVQVTVAPDPDVEVAVLGLVTQSSAVVIDSPSFPLVVGLPIPDESGGDLDLVAFGISTTGEFLFSSSVGLSATPDADLVHVQIVDRNPILFGEGDTTSVNVSGLYGDGIQRDITSTSVGTEYLTSDPEVFTVTDSGEIVAVGLGRATLIARNGNVQDSVTVDVRPAMSAGFELIVEWPGGYCASLLVTNNTVVPTTDWAVTIDMGNATINSTWQGLFSGVAGLVSVEPQFDWQVGILGGHTKSYTGFCASTPDYEPVLPTVIDVAATY